MLKHDCTTFINRLQRDTRQLTKDLTGIWLRLHEFLPVDEASILHLQQDLQQLRNSLDELEQLVLTPVPLQSPVRCQLVEWICQTDNSDGSLTPLGGYTFLVAQNKREEGICLIWDEEKSMLTPQILRQVEKEADDAGCRRPLRIYASECLVRHASRRWQFCPIPLEQK
jgi:hypothetical protein